MNLIQKCINNPSLSRSEGGFFFMVKRNYICHICQKRYNSVKELYNHYLTHPTIKDIIYNLYITQNLYFKDLINELSLNKKYTHGILNYFNIIKDKSLIYKSVWENRSKEERENIKTKISKSFDNKTNEEKERFKLSHKWTSEHKVQHSNIMKNVWGIKTEEEIKNRSSIISEKNKLSWKNKSEEELLNYKQKISKTYQEKSDKEKENIRQKISQSNIETWKNKSEEELKEFSNKRKLYYENLTEEQKKNFSEKLSKNIKLAKNNETEESKIQRFLKISNSKKVYWDNISKERKEKIRRNKIEEYKNRPEEKKISRNTNIKLSWEDKSEEELLNFSSKLKSSWVAKSELEKIKFINYHRKEELSSGQYEILNNKDKFKQYLIEYKNNNGDYPTPDILKEDFKFSNTTGIIRYIHQYNLEDYILWNKSLYEQELYNYIKSIYIVVKY